MFYYTDKYRALIYICYAILNNKNMTDDEYAQKLSFFITQDPGNCVALSSLGAHCRRDGVKGGYKSFILSHPLLFEIVYVNKTECVRLRSDSPTTADADTVAKACAANSTNVRPPPDGLELHLTTIHDSIEPKADDYLKRVELMQFLTRAISNRIPILGLSIFGSTVSGLDVRGSDIDIALAFLHDPPPNVTALSVMRRLGKFLWRSGVVEMRLRARVPVIKYMNHKTGLHVDFCFDSDNDAVYKNRVLNVLCEIDERFRVLARLIKVWAKGVGCNDPSNGTLNSFALNLLVAHHLMMATPPVLPSITEVACRQNKTYIPIEEVVELGKKWKIDHGSKNSASIAELYVSFFASMKAMSSLWSEGLVACPLTADWRVGNGARGRAMMDIEDPFNVRENVARTVIAPAMFKHVQNSFCSRCDFLLGV